MREGTLVDEDYKALILQNQKLKKALEKWLVYAETVCDGMGEERVEKAFREAIEASKP